ncbi:MAG: 6-bladed beta-propeller [Candidatus Aminicenantaceae bacterium]
MHMRILFASTVILISLFGACSSGDQITLGELDPTLVFESRSDDENYSFTAARNIALDAKKNLYVFDYMDNTIKKYDLQGAHIFTFGGQGEGEGQFSHLMEIRVFKDKLLALDSIGILTFTLDGDFVDKIPFQEEVVCEFPQVFEDGRWAGERYSQADVSKSLTLRDSQGAELSKLAEFDLREYFPELKAAEDFFLQDYQARFYLYSFREDGSLIWAASDECKVYAYKDGASSILFSNNYAAVPIPPEQIAEMEKSAERAKANPMLHMYVPQSYQIVQHLLAAPNGDIWLYVISAGKTGFLVFSSEGKLKNYYAVNADFDMTRVKVQMFDKALYYVVTGRSSVKIYSSPIGDGG